MWIHNFAAMVEQCGGRVVKTRWESPTASDKQGLYFVFARPERTQCQRDTSVNTAHDLPASSHATHANVRKARVLGARTAR